MTPVRPPENKLSDVKSAEAELATGVSIPAWRRTREAPSLAEAYRTVDVSKGNWFRKLLAFGGPGYLVAVGYMDPGNWATDLAGGAQFGYALLYVILLSNLMAVLLQARFEQRLQFPWQQMRPALLRRGHRQLANHLACLVVDCSSPPR